MDLSDRTLSRADDAPIDLRGATITGDLDLTNADVEVPLLLGNAAITGSINANGARFHEPVELTGAAVGSSLRLPDVTFDGGLEATGLEAGFMDARGLTASGPVVFDAAEFSVNVYLARAAIDGALSLERATFSGALDLTAVETAAVLSLAEATVRGELTANAVSVNGDLQLDELAVTDEAVFHHSVVSGTVSGRNAQFDGSLQFADLHCAAGGVEFDGCTVDGRTDFLFLEAGAEGVSMTDATLDGEVWFTYADIVGDTTLAGTRTTGHTHLRDATFGGDLILRDVEFESQSYLHGSTIEGNVDATGAHFEHFQFSATVNGEVSFADALFDARAHFTNSEITGDATFERASFAGTPDFSDSRFKSGISFDETEFLVEPVFDGTRFAVSPDFESATFPLESSTGVLDQRETLIVARPDELSHRGVTLPIDSITGDPQLPDGAATLVHPDTDLSAAITAALQELDGADWYDLSSRALELSRTAVSELGHEDPISLVYGVCLDSSATDPEALLTEVRLAGAYRVDAEENQVTFSHLDPALDEFAYLIVVTGDDDAFESGAGVASRDEYRTAIVRRQLMQTMLLKRDEQEDKATVINDMLPVLVAGAQLDESG
ncbi:pentapeptide repeat-containing protein [Halosegnis marinus]|uniref:Pentapeptide repeat-containing protein n=2 Tax=Halosegnis marinus TaxID=3034023 RepID=A0ABD5ZT53_9EURY|nr:pentapeptide repeat-containing protein [Halosegnis sp. DT85]